MEWTKEVDDKFWKAVEEKAEESAKMLFSEKKAQMQDEAYRDGYRKGRQAGMTLGYRKAMVKILDYVEENLDHNLYTVKERE